MKIEIEYTEEDLKLVDEISKPVLSYIRDNAGLTSLLYDIDLLPEQIKLPVNAIRMCVITRMYQELYDKKDQASDEQA